MNAKIEQFLKEYHLDVINSNEEVDKSVFAYMSYSSLSKEEVLFLINKVKVNKFYTGFAYHAFKMESEKSNLDLGLLKKIIDVWAKKGFKNWHGNLPQFEILKEDRVEVLSLLIDTGIDINIKDDGNGETVLMRAVANSAEKSVDLLIKRGADINTQNRYGNRPLFLAATGERNGIFKKLMNAGAKVNFKNDLGETALSWASNDNSLEAVKELIKAGAKVNSKDNNNYTDLMWAANMGHIKVCEVLIENGAELSIQNNQGDTALMFAAKNDYDDIVDLFLKSGARIDCKNKKGFTAKDFAGSNSRAIFDFYELKENILWDDKKVSGVKNKI